MNEDYKFSETPDQDIVSRAYATMKFGDIAVSRFKDGDGTMISFGSTNGQYISGMIHMSRKDMKNLGNMLLLVAGDPDA